MSVNKLNWITDANFLINLPNQLETKISCGDVKFRTKTTAATVFSLSDLFLYVEKKASTDSTFASAEVITALRTIKHKRDEALENKAPKWSIKWICGLLVQLGRAIARFLSCGCKTFNYDASLSKLSLLAKPSEAKQKDAAQAAIDDNEEVEDEESDTDEEPTPPITAAPTQSPIPLVTDTEPDHAPAVTTDATPTAPSSPPAPVRRTRFTDGYRTDVRLILEKLEKNEPITIAEYNTIRSQIVTLDLTTWRAPRQVAIITETGSRKFEWITTFINHCQYLRQVIVPSVKLDPNLFHWLVVDPENKNTTVPDYSMRRPQASSLLAFGGNGDGIVLSRSDKIELEFPTPSLGDIPPLTINEAGRLYSFFREESMFNELLTVNFPNARNKTVAHNLQAILHYSSYYLNCAIDHIQHLCNENFELSPFWSRWFVTHDEESLQKLYAHLYATADDRKYLIPFIEALNLAMASEPTVAADNPKKAILIKNQSNFLINALMNYDNTVEFTHQVINYLLMKGVKSAIFFTLFSTDTQFENFVDHFLSLGTTADEKTTRKNILLNLEYALHFTRLPQVIDKLKLHEPEFCPVKLFKEMAPQHTGTEKDTNYLKNSAYAAFMTILRDPQPVEKQQADLIELINTLLRHMIPEKYLLTTDSSLTHHIDIINQLALNGTPQQLSFLISALLTNYVTIVAERVKFLGIITLLLDNLINNKHVDGIEKLTAFFRTYWSYLPRLPEGIEINERVKGRLRSFRSKEQINAFLRSANEVCLLEPQGTVALLPHNVLPLNNWWFEELFAFQRKQILDGVSIGVSMEEIAALLSQYPELCLRIEQSDVASKLPYPQTTFGKIFTGYRYPGYEYQGSSFPLKKEVISKAIEHVDGIYEHLAELTPDPRNLVLEYAGFDAAAIAKAKANDSIRMMAMRPLPKGN